MKTHGRQTSIGGCEMAPSVDFPKKLFYKIQEVANIVGVEPYVLRYWETKFPMLSPEKDSSDQRRYRRKDIELLLRIRELLYEEKYTIAGAVERLKGEMRSSRGGRKRTSSGDGAQRPSASLFVVDLPADADSETPAFEEKGDGLSGEQREALRRVREELGLLKRELETWRDEIG